MLRLPRYQSSTLAIRATIRASQSNSSSSVSVITLDEVHEKGGLPDEDDSHVIDLKTASIVRILSNSRSDI